MLNVVLDPDTMFGGSMPRVLCTSCVTRHVGPGRLNEFLPK